MPHRLRFKKDILQRIQQCPISPKLRSTAKQSEINNDLIAVQNNESGIDSQALTKRVKRSDTMHVHV